MNMNDTDRGAYTPHHDAPLAFDARRPTDRRPLPMTLIASAAVLVAIVAALVLAYRGGVRGAESPKPVGEPVSAIKTAAAPEGPAEADPRLDVYAAQNVPTSAPNFAPPPETPQARPAPVAAVPPPQLQVRTVDTRMRIEAPEPAPAPSAASRPVQVAASQPAPAVRPAPAVTAPTAATTASAKAAAPLPSATTVTRATAVATPVTATAVPAAARSGAAAVQIGAFSSRALADKGFADSSALVSAAGRGRSVEQVQRDGKTFYRATLTGFADKAAAKAFCDKLAAKGGRCIVKG